jgi:hypothetical protein
MFYQEARDAGGAVATGVVPPGHRALPEQRMRPVLEPPGPETVAAVPVMERVALAMDRSCRGRNVQRRG